MGELKNPYGLKDGRIVYVDDVDNGLSCGCICPECEQPLNAKNQGDEREHHFAHWGSQPCKGSQDTTLHLLTVQILEDELCIMAPSYKGVIPPMQLHFKHLEKETLGLSQKKRPDVIGTCEDGTQIYISIRCTSDVDEDKRRKIIDLGLISFEIHVRICPINESELREFLQDKTSNRQWFNHPKYESRYQEEERRREEIRRKNELEREQKVEEKGKKLAEEFSKQKIECEQRDAEENIWNEGVKSAPKHLNVQTIEHEELKARREPVVVERPIAKPLEDGPIKDYYKSLHPHDVFKPYKAEQTVIVNFGLSYSRRAIFVIHVNKPYKGISYPFHLSRITYGDNGYEYEYIGAYATEQLAEWRYLKLKEDL